MMLNHLDDEIIIESYYKSIHWKLDSNFISILKEEINKRNIPINKEKIVV